MKKLLISAAAAAIITGAAYAQTEFYVVQDTSTKKCTIVDKADHHHYCRCWRRQGVQDAHRS